MPIITLICLFAALHVCWLKGPAGGRTRPRRGFKSIINYFRYFYIHFWKQNLYLQENIFMAVSEPKQSCQC